MAEQVPDWKKAENEINEQLGVQATVSSGNQWYEKGDGTTKEHSADSDAYRFEVDEKSTVKSKYTIDAYQLKDWCNRAIRQNKIFLLPIRFELGRDREDVLDYVVLRLTDFRFLLGLDEVIQYRKKSAESKDNKLKFEHKLSKVLLALDALAKSPNLSDKAKNVLWKSIDIIDKSMDEL